METYSGCDIRIYSHWPTGQWSFKIYWPDMILTGPAKLDLTNILDAKLSIGLLLRVTTYTIIPVLILFMFGCHLLKNDQIFFPNSKLRVHPASSVHNLAAGCTCFGTCAPGECTIFQSISLHYIGLSCTRIIHRVHNISR